MNEDQLDDLKQFIDSRISQAEARFGDKTDDLQEGLTDLRKELNDLQTEMHDGFTGVGEAIEEINKQVDERLTKLEQ